MYMDIRYAVNAGEIYGSNDRYVSILGTEWQSNPSGFRLQHGTYNGTLVTARRNDEAVFKALD
jgi:hypothetical protein